MRPGPIPPCPKRWRWRPRPAMGVRRCAWCCIAGSCRGGFVFYTNYNSRKAAELAREPARGGGVSLAAHRASGAHRRKCAEADARGIRSLLPEPAAREPLERVGVSAERKNFRTIVSRRRVRARAIALRHGQDSVSAVLGWVQNCRELYRVLAGTAASAARSCGLYAKGKILGVFQGGTIEKSFISHDRVSSNTWRVVIKL